MRGGSRRIRNIGVFNDNLLAMIAPSEDKAPSPYPGRPETASQPPQACADVGRRDGEGGTRAKTTAAAAATTTTTTTGLAMFSAQRHVSKVFWRQDEPLTF